MDELRVESVELYHVRMRLKSPFRTSFGIEHDRDCIIIRADCGGEHGWGECVAGEFPGYSYETAGTAWHVLQDFFLPILLETPLESPKALGSALNAYKGHPLARAGLEMALWDLQGKLDGQSLQAMLGGVKERVPVGVSIGIQPTLAAMFQRVEEYLAQGYGRIKIKIAPGNDLEVVAGVRGAFPGIALQVDANAAYAIEDGARLAGLDEFDLQLIEQPFAEDDLLDHARFQDQIQTPVCLDESIGNRRHARQALAIDACRVINIKAGRVGGLTEAVAIHDLCLEAGIPVWCGGMLETGIGRSANLALASLPGFTLHSDISASARYYEQDIATPLFTLNPDSTIDVLQDPGLGVEIDVHALQQFSLQHQAFHA
ncbi:MAG: o-succinylbenzoate synthase [Anaerolineales bacterium]